MCLRGHCPVEVVCVCWPTGSPRGAPQTPQVLGDLSYDDIKEMGVLEVGPRRKIFRAITVWREERDLAKMDSMRHNMDRVFAKEQQEQMDQRLQGALGALRQSVFQS